MKKAFSTSANASQSGAGAAGRKNRFFVSSQPRQILWFTKAAFVLVAAAAGSLPARASDLYWDLNGASSGASAGTTAAGTWNAMNAYWNTDSTGGDGTFSAWQPEAVAVFSAGANATGSSTVTVSGTQQVKGLLFEEGLVTLSGGILQFSGGATFTKSSGAGDCSINSLVQGNGVLQLTGSGPYGRLNGVVSDSGGTLSITSDSDWVFGGQHTFSGGMTITGGLVVPTVSSTGSASTGNLTSGPFGTGTLVLTSGILRPTSGGDITVGNAVTLDGDFTFGEASSSRNLAFSGPLTLTGNRTLTVTSSQVFFNGVLDDGGSGFGFTKSGTSALTLGGNNTFTGGVTIDNGTLTLASAGALNSTTPNSLSFASNANTKKLQLGGNSVTVASLSTGATVGTSIVENGSAGAATLTVNNAAANTFAGVLQDGTAGTLALTKTGAGTLALTSANTYTGATTVLNGTLTIASGGSIGVASATPGSLKIGESTTASLVVQAGGELSVGNGGGDSLLVGARTTLNGATDGTLNMSAASRFTADVGLFQVGGSTSTNQANASGSAKGTVTLAANNTITASTGIVVAEMIPAVANTSVTSTLRFGAGANNVATPSFLIGGSRSTGTVTIAAGGTLNLDNGAGKTNLTIGQNRVANTGTYAVGVMNMTGGILIADLDQLIIGDKVSASGGGAGTATGTLTLGAAANSVTANSVILGNQVDAASSSTNTTAGTLNMGGGTFAVANDVKLGFYANGGYSKGTLNLTGGTFTVDGNITSTDNAKSISIVTLDGATLDMTSGSIDANTFNAYSGTLQNVTQIYNGDGSTAAGLTKSSAGTLTLGGNNTFTGGVTIDNGALILGSAGALNSTTPNSLSFASNANTKKLQLGGNSVTVASLSTGATVGTSIVENGSAGAATLTVDNAAANTFAGVLQDGTAGTLALTKTGDGTLVLSSSNTYTGGTAINAGTLQLGASDVLGDTGAVTVGGGTLDINTRNDTIGAFTLGSGSVTGTTGVLTASGYNVQSGTMSAALGGSGALTKTTGGTVTLSGTTPNTYTGLTTVSEGILLLDKTGGNAVGGDVLLNGGDLRFIQSNQIIDTAAVTLSSPNSAFNGTGPNTNQLDNIAETIASITATEGTFNTGFSSNWTITGAGSFTAGTDTRFVGNSGTLISFGSLSLSGMTGMEAAAGGNKNAFTLYGNDNSRQSTLTVGSGGLTLTGSRLELRPGSDGAKGAKLVLDGDVTVNGGAVDSIIAKGGTGSAPVAIDLNGGTRTFDVAGSADLTVDIPITNGAGTGGLIKTGTGTLTLSGANTYTGGVTVNDGTLTLGNAGALNSTTPNSLSFASNANTKKLQLGGNSVTVAGLSTGATVGTSVVENGSAGAATLTVNNAAANTFAGVLQDGTAGTLALTKTGAGTLTLGGATPNTYTGLTTVNGGTLSLSKSSGVIAVAGNILVSSGTLLLVNPHQIADTSDIAVNGSANFDSGQKADTVRNLTLNSSYSDPNNQRLSNLSIAGTLTMTKGVAGLNSGTSTFANAVNMGGNSQIDFAANTGDTTLRIGGGGLTMSGATLRLGWTGLDSPSTARVNLGGDFTGSGANSIRYLTTVGQRLLDLQGAVRTFDIVSGTTTIDPAIQNGGLIKEGAGTLVLNGASTYAGATTVNGGTLLVNNTTGSGTGSGAVTVGTGAILGGSGAVGGATTIQSGGTLSPGNSPGIQTYAAGLIMDTGSTFSWELVGNTISGRGTNFDGVDVTGGNLEVQNGVHFNLILDGSLNGDTSAVNFTDSFWDGPQQWLLFDVQNTATASVIDPSTFLLTVSEDKFGNAFPVDAGFEDGFANFYLSQDASGDIFLNYSAVVPEPATTGLLALMLGGWLTFFRRRRKL